MPPGLPRRAIPAGAEYQKAAVLLALHPGGDGGTDSFRFPLIRRPDGILHHPGQISLPGGRLDECEEPRVCALREAWEEVGIDPSEVEVLGRLTPIAIPVTLYEVEAFVGWIPRPPRFRLQEEEVAELLSADPDRLAVEGPTLFVERVRDGGSFRFPAYDVAGWKVWGATALLLSEFLEIWRARVRRAMPPGGRNA